MDEPHPFRFVCANRLIIPFSALLPPNASDGLYDYVFLITIPTFAAWREKSLVLSPIKLIGVFHSTSLEKLLEASPFRQLQAGNFGRLPYF